MYLAPDLIETIHAIELPLYKHLAIEIASGFLPELISDLQNKIIDLALVTSPTPNAALTTLCIATHQFVIIFRKGHPVAAKQSVIRAVRCPPPVVWNLHGWFTLPIEGRDWIV